MSFKNKLQHNRKGSQYVTEYMFFVKRIDDELYVIDHVISNDDVTLYVLNGLSAKYRDIVASIHTRDRLFSFEELHSHLVAREEFLKRDDYPSEVLVLTTNFHQKNKQFWSHHSNQWDHGGFSTHSPHGNEFFSPNQSFNYRQGGQQRKRFPGP